MVSQRGKGAIYAPPFPRWLEKPGFWDECFYADIRLTRLYTVLFCDSAGRPARLRSELLSWRPDRLIVEHRSDSHRIRETRLVTEDHEWVSVFELLSGSDLDAFVWSLQEMREPGYGAPWQSLTACSVARETVSFDFATAWPAELEPDRSATEDERVSGESAMLEPLVQHLEFGANQPRASHTVNLAQRHDDSPLWETSLLPQKLRAGRLPGDFKLQVGPPPVEGLVHIVQQYELKSGEPLVVWCRASIPSTSGGGEGVFRLGPEIVAQNERAWRDYFASVPQFNSSDPYLTAAYWYRWYGLRLNTVDIPDLPICKPDASTFSSFITEGVGFFRNFVTYSAQAHLREVAWMHSPRLGLGILENLAKCQRADGSFPGHNYSCRPARDFYHADFATGTDLLRRLHPPDVAPQQFNFLRRYALYLYRERKIGMRGIEPSGEGLEGMLAVFDQNETGQEYMSRYQFASDNADQWRRFLVAGVDATTYGAMLFSFLNRHFKDWKNLPRQYSWSWLDVEDGLWFALNGHYDTEADFFTDLILDGSRSIARPATGFYPLLTSVLQEYQSAVLQRWLLNPNEFWLPKGFPATALSDPTYSAVAEWKDKRLNCPWNGRSWPMVNSHLVDAIANVARMTPSTTGGGAGEGVASQTISNKDNQPGGTDLRAKAGEALMKAITLMFHDADPAQPNSYEHYDPFTGTPSLYRGYDDYMHSWLVDLILRHAVGVKPGEDDVDPLPLGVDWIECTDIPHPRGRMNVRIEEDKVKSVTIVE